MFGQWRSVLIVLGLVVSGMWPAGESMSAATEEKTKMCTEKWFDIVNEHGKHNYGALLESWQKLSDECAGTGLYEYRLSTIYERLGEIEKAQEVVRSVSKTDTEYSHYLKLADFSYQYILLVESGSRDRKSYDDVEHGYVDLIKEYPKWPAAYEQLATIQRYLGKRDEAIATAKQALALDESSWKSYRVLVVAYTESRKYSEAKPLIRTAVELNEGLLADSEFMLASATTYINMQEPQTAEAVLLALAERSPDVQKDARFQAIVQFLQSAKDK